MNITSKEYNDGWQAANERAHGTANTKMLGSQTQFSFTESEIFFR